MPGDPAAPKSAFGEFLRSSRASNPPFSRHQTPPDDNFPADNLTSCGSRGWGLSRLEKFPNAFNHLNSDAIATVHPNLLPEPTALATMISHSIIRCFRLIFRSKLPFAAESPTETLAGVAQLAEHNVANVVVVGSNPITRSFE